MDQLRAGDFVLSEKGQWVEVVSWMHRDEQAVTEFMEVSHSNGMVTLSPDHLIWVINEQGERQDMPAGDVSVGAWLIDEHGVMQQVTNVERKTHEGGIYAPLTSTGDIVVDGVLCSCFNAIELPAPFYQNNHQLGLIGTLPQRWMPSVFGSLENPNTSEFSPLSRVMLQVVQYLGKGWNVIA